MCAVGQDGGQMIYLVHNKEKNNMSCIPMHSMDIFITREFLGYRDLIDLLAL